LKDVLGPPLQCNFHINQTGCYSATLRASNPKCRTERETGTVVAHLVTMQLFKTSLLLVSALSLVALGRPSQARACSQRQGPQLWAIDSGQAADQIAPTITAHTAAVTRTTPTTDPANSCYGVDFSALSLQLYSTDNINAAGQIGYEFKVIAGALPPSMIIPKDVLIPPGEFNFSMSSNDPRVAFTLEVRAVDGNGNRSAALKIVIDEQPMVVDEIAGDDNKAGCSTSSPTPFAGNVILLGMMALARRRRRF
jgi:uncharacterized protein (TIGR03382 family)